MLSRFNAVDIESALAAAAPRPQFPPATDRAAWAAIRAQIGEEATGAIIARAETAAQTPLPALPATLFLEFQRNGQREGYQVPQHERRAMLASLTFAECLEGRSRFLDPLLDVAWATCEESSWVLPAHQSVLTDMRRPVIDLGVAGTALALAEMDHLLGAQLDPLMGERIRYELDRRCFVPYLNRHDWWWLYNTAKRRVNNWTAVCNCGVVGAALYVEKDLARLAELVARAARSMDDYLATFDRDGGSTEGPGYWSYGFGHYTIFAQLVEWRTGGRLRFMDEPIVRKAAQFPLHTMLTPGTWVNFSDCDRNIHFIPAHLTYLSQRLDLPDLMRLARVQPHTGRRQDEIIWGLRDLVWRPTAEPTGDFVPSRTDWYPEMTWLLARFDPSDPNALVMAAKGGHNEEMHNQNDVGNFVVRVNQDSVIPDVGRGRYTRAYFGPQRYEHFVNSSLGHSVPIPNGQQQLPGIQHRAELVTQESSAKLDALTIELKDAYPAEAGLASLRRTIALHRDAPAGWVELTDEVTFTTGPGQCESNITTFAQVELGPSSVLLRGERGALRISYDPAVLTPRVVVEKDVDLALGAADVTRLVFALCQPAESATLRLRIEPA